jgi:predicted DNA-binding protein
MKIIREGQTGVALVRERGRVPVVYEYRTLTLDSGVMVKDVLVGVDRETGEVLTLPAQSTPKVKLAREARKDETFSVRIPTELGDVLWGVSYEFGANPTKFISALIRFYLNEAAEEPSVAKRFKRLSTTELASAASRSRLTVRSGAELLRRLTEVEEREGVSRSELVRGAVVAAKEDVFDRPVKSRLAQLRAIAEAV